MSQPLPTAPADLLPAPLADLLADAAIWPAKLRTMTEIVVAEAHRLQTAGDTRGALRLIEMKGLQLDRYLGEAPGDEAKLDAMIADGIDATWLRIAINCYARAAVALGDEIYRTPAERAHIATVLHQLGLAR
ncbi:MAG TPA: hypothetical protein DHW63_01060 [Hyphomonadaceae bacterium]|nr:hypothetical protein [Hyphomonadaceae bacterium]